MIKEMIEPESLPPCPPAPPLVNRPKPRLKKNNSYFFCGNRLPSSEKKRITPLITLIFCVLPLAFVITTACAATENKPTEAIACPDRAQAEAGSMVDEYYLARAYDKGYCGMTVNRKTAEDWYIKAARQGHTLAQYYLGEMYFEGDKAAPPDYPQAKQWYLAAGLQGYGPAQLRLGFLYAEAHFKGLTTDYAEAEKWFLKAAEQNAGDAQFRLGNFYHNYKRPPEMDKAILWLTRAAEGGHHIAMFDLARLLKDSKKYDQALAWMKKAAEHDLLPAQMLLSEMYASGDGVTKDAAQSMFWTLRIANNPIAALFWINKAADAYFDGAGIPQDYARALELYTRAAEKNDPHALARINEIHLKELHNGITPQK